jgi:mannose/cellobiose epimerase-like protein (N-acyl-D-glucosamine 2-epimerase family)
VTGAAGEVHYSFRADWTPEPGAERFGYAFQAARRMIRAAPLLPDLPLEARAAALLERATRVAAVRGGGFCAAGPAAQPGLLRGTSPPDSRRAWWVQVEALRALAAAAALPSPADAEGLLRRQWTFIRTQMLDRAFGGIYPTCPRDLRAWNRPFGRLRQARDLRKGDAWKDASHETDSLLACMSILRRADGLR